MPRQSACWQALQAGSRAPRPAPCRLGACPDDKPMRAPEQRQRLQQRDQVPGLGQLVRGHEAQPAAAVRDHRPEAAQHHARVRQRLAHARLPAHASIRVIRPALAPARARTRGCSDGRGTLAAVTARRPRWPWPTRAGRPRQPARPCAQAACERRCMANTADQRLPVSAGPPGACAPARQHAPLPDVTWSVLSSHPRQLERQSFGTHLTAAAQRSAPRRSRAACCRRARSTARRRAPPPPRHSSAVRAHAASAPPPRPPCAQRGPSCSVPTESATCSSTRPADVINGRTRRSALQQRKPDPAG